MLRLLDPSSDKLGIILNSMYERTWCVCMHWFYPRPVSFFLLNSQVKEKRKEKKRKEKERKI
jgi:hypothetical protein